MHISFWSTLAQASSTSNLTEQDQSSQTALEPHHSTVNFDPQCQDEGQKKVHQ